MKPRSPVRLLFLIGLAALLMVGRASAADVRVMISAGFYRVYSELGPVFERASGHHLVTTRGPSMGDSPEAIPARLARGEAADLVIWMAARPTNWPSATWCEPAARSSSRVR
jgi:molybdate transport system substrate-binding protein